MNEFFEHYMDIMADPAHLAAEVTLMLLVDFLFLGLVWPFLKRWMNNRVHAEHRVLDAEHGVDHHPPRRGVHLRGKPARKRRSAGNF